MHGGVGKEGLERRGWERREDKNEMARRRGKEGTAISRFRQEGGVTM